MLVFCCWKNRHWGLVEVVFFLFLKFCLSSLFEVSFCYLLILLTLYQVNVWKKVSLWIFKSYFFSIGKTWRHILSAQCGCIRIDMMPNWKYLHTVDCCPVALRQSNERHQWNTCMCMKFWYFKSKSDVIKVESSSGFKLATLVRVHCRKSNR